VEPLRVTHASILWDGAPQRLDDLARRSRRVMPNTSDAAAHRFIGVAMVTGG
jgi:hypothetical protein